MKLFIKRISKSQLNNIPENERNFFLFIGHLANEINILQKLTIMCINKSSANNAEERAHMAQAILIVKILVGKVWEAWELITQIFNKDLSQKYEQKLPCETKKALEELRVYFNKKTKTIIYQVRNKFSFHYDPRKIKSIFNKLSDDLEMDIYLHDNNANSFYYGSEVFVNSSMLEMIYPDDLKVAIDRLMKETIKVAGLLIDFIGNCMYLFVSNYFLDDRGQICLDIVEVGVPSISEVTIPYFVVK